MELTREYRNQPLIGGGPEEVYDLHVWIVRGARAAAVLRASPNEGNALDPIFQDSNLRYPALHPQGMDGHTWFCWGFGIHAEGDESNCDILPAGTCTVVEDSMLRGNPVLQAWLDANRDDEVIWRYLEAALGREETQ